MKITKREGRVIAELQAVARHWPKSLWLFSANGSLHVMKKGKASRVIEPSGAVSPRAIITRIDIENDGGDF